MAVLVIPGRAGTPNLANRQSAKQLKMFSLPRHLQQRIPVAQSRTVCLREILLLLETLGIDRGMLLIIGLGLIMVAILLGKGFWLALAALARPPTEADGSRIL